MSRVVIISIVALTIFVFLGFTVTAYNPVNNPPSFTKGADQTINEDAPAQTVNGWATNIDAGQGDSGQTLDFIVTNDNNQLFSAQPAVAPNGTLTYKSAANAFGLATVTVKLHDNGGGTDTSAPQTFKITVKPVADFPNASPATTLINTQSTSGLVIDRNPVDGPEVTHFKMFSITNGRLFKHDGITEIPSGGVITLAEGQAGLKFTPDPGLFSPQTFFFFTVVAGLGPAQGDFNSGFLTVGIGVTCTEAQVMMVTNSNDSGPGSLRDVLNNACSGSKVAFDMSPGHVTSPITLTSGELQIFQDQTIAGPTATGLVISGNNNSRIFNINQLATVKIANLTITGGKANTGGGIRSQGKLTIQNSTLTGNHAAGTDGSGGALDTLDGSLLMTNSTISGNTAEGYGGGLRNSVNNATLINVTVTDNRADSNGDGLEFAGGIIQFGNNMNLRNSLVAGNFRGAANTASDLTGQSSDPYAAISSNNLIGVNDVSTGLSGTTNLLGSLANPINPMIGPLADNGGPTRTHLLLLGSPAIKAAVNSVADGIATDQRGFNRAASGPIDIGAVEVSATISATAGTPQSAPSGNAFATPLKATVTESGIPKSGVLVTFAAPANGPSGSFSGSATVSTDANGVATAPAFTANGIVGGPYNVTASFVGGSSQAVFALTNTLPVAQVALGNLLQTFDGNPKSVSVTTNPPGLTVAVTYNGSATAPTNAGSYAVIATVNSPNFIGQASGNLVIQPANQQITFGALADKKFGDADFGVSATASSNLAVSFSAGGNCTITGTLVHLTGAGQCTITASQNGNSNFNAATPVVRVFTIGKSDQQITFDALPNKKFRDADFGVSATASSNLAVGFSAGGNCTIAGTLVHLTGAGSCTITASQNGNASFNAAPAVARTFAVAKADQQITFAALSNKSANAPDFAVSATASSNLAVSFAAAGSCTVVGTQVHLTSAGQCTITASQAGDANWNAATPVARTFSIVKANQVITFNALSNKAVGDADFGVTATASSGLAVVFSASGSCTVNGAQVHLTGGGQCTITASQNGDAIWNAASPVARTFSIGKADQQITFAALPDKGAGDTDFAITATASSGLAITFSASGSCTVNGAQVHLTGAGQCTITASQPGDSNFNPAAPVSRTFSITEASPTPTPTPTPTPSPTPTPTPSPSPSPSPDAPTVQFAAPVYLVSENELSAAINVTRTGDTSGPATVDYLTADTDTFVLNCAAKQGQAYGRCDFATVVGTLKFAAGETSRTFQVPIIDDAYAEGNETFTVSLRNPNGATLGPQATATVSIDDNETVDGANPILRTDDAGIAFFVRQQYLDFLGREPEPGEPWSNILRTCSNPLNTDPNSPAAGCDEITVSGAFFGSPEFKNKGIYIIDFYRVAFNRLPTYLEFSRDLASITGATADESRVKRAVFASQFVQRTEFTNTYGSMDNTTVVNTLMGGGLGQAYNLTSIDTPDPANPEDGIKVTLTSEDLIRKWNGTVTRQSQIVRAIVESDQIAGNLEAVNAFVASQYYGYLRRTPDADGFNGWVTYLRNNPNDFRTMVHGFLNSTEYRSRFGPQ